MDYSCRETDFSWGTYALVRKLCASAHSIVSFDAIKVAIESWIFSDVNFLVVTLILFD